MNRFDTINNSKISQLSLASVTKRKWMLNNQCYTVGDAIRAIESGLLTEINSEERSEIEQIADRYITRTQEIEPLIMSDEYTNARAFLKTTPVSTLKLTKRVEQVISENGLTNAFDAAEFIFKEHLMSAKGVGYINAEKARAKCISAFSEFKNKTQPIDLSQDTFHATLVHLLSDFGKLVTGNSYKLQYIINHRFGVNNFDANSRLEVAKRLQISHQRVKQLENRIFEILDKILGGEITNNNLLNQNIVAQYHNVLVMLRAKGYVVTKSEATKIILGSNVKDEPLVGLLMESLGYFDIGIECVRQFNEPLFAQKGKANGDQIKQISRHIKGALTTTATRSINEVAKEVYSKLPNSIKKSKIHISDIKCIIRHAKFCKAFGDSVTAKLWHLTALEVAYEALKQHKKPMTLKDLRNKVNEMRNEDLSGCEKNKLIVHNIGNISSDPRFKASKHGLWMLSNWEEFTTEPLMDTMQRICREQKGSMSREELIEMISKSRPEYSKQTIAVYIPKISGVKISRASKNKPSLVIFN